MTRYELPHSTRIKSIAYDPKQEILEVIFRSGDAWIYAFEGIPQEKFIGIQNAHSPGRYFDAEIKGKYKFRKIAA